MKIEIIVKRNPLHALRMQFVSQLCDTGIFRV